MQKVFICVLCLINSVNLFSQQQNVPIDSNSSHRINDSVFVQQSAASDSLNVKKDSIHYKRNKILKSFIVPVSLIGVGSIVSLDNDENHVIDKYTIRKERNKKFGFFHTKIDNYLQYAPIAALYTMNALGYKGRHDVINQTDILIKSELLMTVLVTSLKRITHEERPDGSAYNSFPSGHAAQAFLSAEVLRREYGKQFPGLAIGGYVAATAVGALRVLNNRHWVSDVIAGAGFGILSVNVVYITHKNRLAFRYKKKPSSLSVMPYYNGSAAGACAAVYF